MEGWQPYHFNVQTALTSGSLNILKPCGSVIGLYMDCFTFLFT